MLFLDGKARLLPRREAALQLGHVGEARFLQQPAGRGTGATVAVGHEHRLFLVLGDLAHAAGELAERDVARSGQVSLGELLRLAHVEHERAALVHEPRGLERADLRAAHAGELRDLGPHEHEPARQEEGDEAEVVHQEFAHGEEDLRRAAKPGSKKEQFYPIAHCRNQTTPIPPTIEAMTLRVTAATAIATRPAIQRRFPAEGSKRPWLRRIPGATIAASTAGGTNARAWRKKRGKRCGSAKTMKEARSTKVVMPTHTMASQVLTGASSAGDRAPGPRRCRRWSPRPATGGTESRWWRVPRWKRRWPQRGPRGCAPPGPAAR